MAQLDKPNVVIPLAASFNTRVPSSDVDDLAIDQQKYNCISTVANNAFSGNSKLYLSKRPGIGQLDNVTFGTSTDTEYLVCVRPGVTANRTNYTAHWVFSIATDNQTHKVSDSSGSTTIFTSSSFKPSYVDLTSISGTQNAVVQYAQSSGAQRVFFASTRASWTEITDGDFTGLAHIGKMEHIDGYAVVMTTNNRLHNSDLNSLANWTASSYITKSIKEDSPGGLARHGRIILAFGQETMEAFYNAGNASGSPLSRINGLTADVGIGNENTTTYAVGSRHYYAAVGGRTYFIGSPKSARFNPAIYMFDGSKVEKVSTKFIDNFLAGMSNGSFSLWNGVFHGRSALFVQPDTYTAPSSWAVFIPELNDWSIWKSALFNGVTDGYYYLGNPGASTANMLGGHGYSFNDYIQSGGASSYSMGILFKLPQTGADRKRMHFAGVIGDTQTSASDLSISFSDDDYQTFSTARTIDLTQAKKQIYRCGNYRGRAVKLEHSANTDCRLEAFIARVEE